LTTPNAAAFTVTPTTATMGPGASVDLSVEFTPQEAHEHHLQIGLRIANNPRRDAGFGVRGRGLVPRIRFDPGNVTLAPALPGIVTQPTRVRIRNDSDISVELFSVDFDETFLTEEVTCLLRWPQRLILVSGAGA
jgi:hypothetical protein